MPTKPKRILPFREKAKAGDRLPGLSSIGPKCSAWLLESGIDSAAEVRRLGPIEVCRMLRARGHLVSVILAYALEGALTGCAWDAIPWETKQALRVEFSRMKKTASSEKIPRSAKTPPRR